MLTFGGLNWPAVVVAAVACFAAGAVWYQPKVMGARWMRAAGVDPADASPKPWSFIGTLVAYFLMAMLLAMIARGIDASYFGEGLVLGLFTGVVFVAAQTWVNVSFEGRSMDLLLVNGGIGVIGHVIMAVIVTTWA